MHETRREAVIGLVQTTLALVAHDHQKDALAHFVLEYRAEFGRFHLVATEGTGQLVQKRTGLRVHLLKPDTEGEDKIASLVTTYEVQAVIFFRDLAAFAPYDPGFFELLHVCDLREIPVATNPSTARALIYFLQNSPDRGIITARCWGIVQESLRGY